jgi:hypothetical protein
MKILALILFLLLPAAALADSWTTSDTVMQLAATGVTTVDWLQTRYISTHPATCSEANIALGQHPTLGRVDAYFASVVAGEVLLAYVAPKVVLLFGGSELLAAKSRTAVQAITIGVEATATSLNFRYGVKMEF